MYRLRKRLEEEAKLAKLPPKQFKLLPDFNRNCHLKLTLDSRRQHSWLMIYYEILKTSGLFSEIVYEEIIENTHILNIQKEKQYNMRGKHGDMAAFRINEKLIIIDTQFDDTRTLSYFGYGLLNVAKPDLYIKLDNRYQLLKDSLPCPLKVWVTFPGTFELVNKFKWVPGNTDNVFSSGPHSYRYVHRHAWFNKAKSLGFSAYITKPLPEYISDLKKSNWGVAISCLLHQSGMTAWYKNTREYEFISNGIPLALNYVPYYDEFPFNPMEHYLHIPNVNDLDKLLTVDPIPYHEKSKWLWDNYFRPDKATQLLLSWL